METIVDIKDALEETRKLVARLETLEEIQEYGFERVKIMEVPSSCKSIFINKSLGLVVKRPYTLGCCGTTDRMPPYAIPTVRLYSPITEGDVLSMGAPEWKKFDEIHIQPLADVSKEAASKALNILLKERVYCDLHSGNVGMYNDKAVAIDW